MPYFSFSVVSITAVLLLRFYSRLSYTYVYMQSCINLAMYLYLL